MASPDRVDRQRLKADYERLLGEEHRSRWSLENTGNRLALAERLDIISSLTEGRLPAGPIDILDLGCGSLSLLHPNMQVGSIVGVDLLFSRLTALRDETSQTPTVNADGANLPFRSNTFDVVVLATMMSSVLSSGVRIAIGQEVERVLRPGGAVLWYDFRLPNPRNRATRAVRRRELLELFPSLDGPVKSLSVLPPLARRLGELSPRILLLLGAAALPAVAPRGMPRQTGPMKFLFLTQYYEPEVGAAQTRLAAVTKSLMSVGHDVEVVTALPNYPLGRIFDQYRGRLVTTGTEKGIRVHRVWMYAAPGTGSRRLLSYLSFTISSVLGLLRVHKPDAIVIESPPLFVAVTGIVYGKLRRIPAILNVADLWPDAAVALGALHGGPVLRTMLAVERWVYRSSTIVSTVTDGVRERLIREQRRRSQDIVMLANGVDTEAFPTGWRRCRNPQEARTSGSAVPGVCRDHGPCTRPRPLIRRDESESQSRESRRICSCSDQVRSGRGPHGARSREDIRNIQFRDPVPLAELAAILPLALVGVVTLEKFRSTTRADRRSSTR